MFPCEHCGRKMTEKALGPHGRACGKGPRKKFDAAKARVEGTEMAEFKAKQEREGRGGRQGRGGRGKVAGGRGNTQVP